MMKTNQVGSDFPDPGFGWGLGMRVRMDRTSAERPGQGAFGWNGGTGTQFEVDPGSGMIVIVFVPTRPGTSGVGELRDEFMLKAFRDR
jgi:CubicO group peptidase (beta-lactamase class C family)